MSLYDSRIKMSQTPKYISKLPDPKVPYEFKLCPTMDQYFLARSKYLQGITMSRKGQHIPTGY